jgi:TPR repeat protein
MAGRIFINYRRDDSIATAGRLHDRLAHTFGRNNLFMDVDHIPAGVDFVDHLNTQLAACDVFLAVIGLHWLDAKDESGRRRIDNPDDFVTLEIAAALARDIRVIPVMVDGAQMPKASDLPEYLKPLVRRNAVEVRNAQFGRDADALAEKVRAALKGARPGSSRWPTATASAVALLLAGWIGLYQMGVPVWMPWTPGVIQPDTGGAKKANANADAKRVAEAKANADAEAKRQAEEASYQAARGDAGKLQSYVSACTVCAFAQDARQEIASIERQREQARPEAEAARQDCNRLAAGPGDRELPPGIVGVGLTQMDSGRAVAACRKALDTYPDEPRLLFLLGRAFHAAKNYAEALPLYRNAADLGDVRATNNLGVMYQNGLGVTKDEAEAVRLYRKAADLGEAIAIDNLGWMYANGRGVAKDEAEAVRLYRKAADLGNARAMNNLGMMYENGRGVANDETEAVRLYRKAADLGNANAMTNLGWRYENGVGVAKDEGEAVRLYRKAADLDNARAMTNLGVMYAFGVGVGKDEGEAVRLYRKAADLGYARAVTNLAVMYANGLGVAKDEAEAVRLYRKAADLGNVDALEFLRDR